MDILMDILGPVHLIGEIRSQRSKHFGSIIRVNGVS